MLIKKITNHLESLYPISKAEKWDKCGLIFGDEKKDISKAVVALDLTTEVFNNALANDVELIIVHHPFVFDKDNLEEELELFEYKKTLVKRIENTGMAIYVMHTNFDFSTKGMKKASIDFIGLETTSEKLDYGVVFKSNMNLMELKNLIIEKYGFNQFITNGPNDLLIKKIAILPGTGGLKDMLQAKKYNVDIILTADIKWSTWISLKEENIYAIQISHQMEKIMINKVENDLENIKGLEVLTYNERIIK